MKKCLGWLLALLVVASAATAYAATDVLIGHVSNADYPELKEGKVKFYTSYFGECWLILPKEGPEARELLDTNLRVTLLEPRDHHFAEDGTEAAFAAKVEFVQGVSGRVTAMSEDSLTLDVVSRDEWPYEVEPGLVLTLALTEDTIVRSRYAVGDDVHLRFDEREDGTYEALVIAIPNG